MIYFDPGEVFGGSAEAASVLADIERHTAELAASGHLVMFQPLNLPRSAITVKVRDGRMTRTDGPFMETKEVLGGFVLIEARDLDQAAQIAAGMPHARLGHVEVRPAIDFSKPRPQL